MGVKAKTEETDVSPSEETGVDMDDELMDSISSRLGVEMDSNPGKVETEETEEAKETESEKDETDEDKVEETEETEEAKETESEKDETDEDKVEETEETEEAKETESEKDETDEDKVEETEEDDESDEGENKIPSLTEKQQKAVDKRIGKSVKKQREAEEKLETAESERDELQEELSELKEKSGKDEAKEVARASDMDPIMGAESEQEIRDYEDFLDDAEDFAEEHKEYGYDGDGTDKYPARSSEQLKQDLKKIKRIRRRVLPEAREKLKKRQEVRTQAQEQYPQVFRNGKYSKEARDVLEEVPGLRLSPDCDLIVGQILAGRNGASESKPLKTSGKKEKKATKEKRQPPVSGGGHRSAGRTAKSGGKNSNINVDEFMSEGGDSAALTKQAAKLME